VNDPQRGYASWPAGSDPAAHQRSDVANELAWFDDRFLVYEAPTDEIPWDRPSNERPLRFGYPSAPGWQRAPEPPGPPPPVGAWEHPRSTGAFSSAVFQPELQLEFSPPAPRREGRDDPYDEFAPLADDLAVVNTTAADREIAGPPPPSSGAVASHVSVFGDFFSAPRRARYDPAPTAPADAPAADEAATAQEPPAAGELPVSGEWPPVPTTFTPRPWESVAKPPAPWAESRVADGGSPLSAAMPAPPQWSMPRAVERSAAFPAATVPADGAPTAAAREELAAATTPEKPPTPEKPATPAAAPDKRTWRAQHTSAGPPRAVAPPSTIAPVGGESTRAALAAHAASAGGTVSAATTNAPSASVSLAADQAGGPSAFSTIALLLLTGVFVVVLVLAFLHFMTGVFR